MELHFEEKQIDKVNFSVNVLETYLLLFRHITLKAAIDALCKVEGKLVFLLLCIQLSLLLWYVIVRFVIVQNICDVLVCINNFIGKINIILKCG